MDRSVGDSRRGRFGRGTVVRSLVAVWFATSLAACGSDVHRPIRPEFDLRDPSATRRLAAISTVESTQDRSQVPTLIEMLDDDDDAVRMSANSTLKAVTGHDTGYRAFAPAEERRAQIATWRAWWRGASSGYTSGGSHGRIP